VSLQCSSTSGNKDDTACLYCNELYSVSTEIWVGCGYCGKWAHKCCAGEDEEDVRSMHICASCTKTINCRRAPFCHMGSLHLAPRMGHFFLNVYSQIKLFFLKYKMSLITLIVKNYK
jgi:hypothetical protein